MAESMRPGTFSMRDIQPAGSNSVWENIAEDLGFKSPSFDPSRKSHNEQLKVIQTGIMAGQFSDNEITDFALKNPSTIPFLQQAIRQRDILKNNLQGENPSLDGAITSSVQKGELGFGKELAQFVPGGKSTDPYEAITTVRMKAGAKLPDGSVVPQGGAIVRVGLNKRTRMEEILQPPRGVEYFQPQPLVVGTGFDTRVFERPSGTNAPRETATFQNEKAIHDEVQVFSKRIADSNVGKFLGPMRFIDKTIRERGDDIPGIGLAKNIGVGDYLKSEEGKLVQSAIQTVANYEIKNLAGTAASQFEENRVAIQNALKVSRTAKDYRNVYEKFIRPAFGLMTQDLAAGGSPRIVDAYVNSGGIDVREIAKEFGSPQGGGKLTPAQQRLKNLLGAK